MKHTFIILFCWLIGCVVVAQKVKFVKEEDGVSYYRMEGKRGNGDTIIVDFRPGCYCYNYNVEQESDKVLKIRGTSDLIPLFLTCENCTQIVSFSQTSRWNSKCISEIVLTAPLSEKQINITMTKKGKLYTTLKVMLYPKVNFFLKINEEMIKMPFGGIPSFRKEDTLRIVAVAEDGTELKIDSHAIVLGNSMGDYVWHFGDVIPENWKEYLLEWRGTARIVARFLDDDGFMWSRYTDF